MGFAWAFLQAGARAVVAGLWDVSDTSTGPLMSKFYDGIAAKRSVAAALREAKLSMLRTARYGRRSIGARSRCTKAAIRDADAASSSSKSWVY